MIVGCGDLTILLVGLGFHCFLLKCKEKLRHSLGRPSRSDFVQLEVVEVIRMKKLYCMNCGAQIKGGIPNECSCGAEFDLADTKNIKKIITSIIFFVILMSPLLILIHFGRQYLQASIILYALLLILGIFWCRIVQTILVRLGLVTITNIEIK